MAGKHRGARRPLILDLLGIGPGHAVALQREYDARVTQETKETASFRTFQVCTGDYSPKRTYRAFLH